MRGRVAVKRESDDFTALLRKWTARLAKPYVQGLIRKLTPRQIEDMIPEEIAPYFRIEDQGDGTLLVIAEDVPEGPAVLQSICDADWEEMQIAQRLERNGEVGSGDGDDDASDALGAVGVNRALGVKGLAGPQPDDLELPGGDDEDVPDGEL